MRRSRWLENFGRIRWNIKCYIIWAGPPNTEQQLEPPGHQYLEPEHIAELMAPVGEFELPTIDPQPIPVNNNALSPEVLSHKEDK